MTTPEQTDDLLELIYVQVITRHGLRTTSRRLPFATPGAERAAWSCQYSQVAERFPDNRQFFSQPLRYRKTQYASTAPDPVERAVEEAAIDEGHSRWELAFAEPDTGDCPDMALTEQGVAQMFQLGQRLRQRYARLLSSASFDPAQFYVRSTDIPRTIMTAQAVLLGLVPAAYRPYATGIDSVDDAAERLDEALSQSHRRRRRRRRDDTDTDNEVVVPHGHSAIPIHVRHHSTETMYPSYSNCPRWAQERAKLRRPFRAVDAQAHGQLRAELLACLGAEASTMLRRGWQSAANVLTPTVGMLPTHLCEHFRARYPHSYSFCQQVDDEADSVLPPCITADIVEALQQAAGLELAYKFQSPPLCRLAIGGFVAELYHDMRAKVADPQSARKLSLYSGHDSTLAPLLSAWGVFDQVLPPLGAYLLIELYNEKATQEKHVRMIYNDAVMPLPLTVAQRTGETSRQLLPGLVSWQNFARITEPITAVDRTAECARLPE